MTLVSHIFVYRPFRVFAGAEESTRTRRRIAAAVPPYRPEGLQQGVYKVERGMAPDPPARNGCPDTGAKVGAPAAPPGLNRHGESATMD